MRRRALHSKKLLGSNLSGENKRVPFHSLICSTLPTPTVLVARNGLAAPADTERLGDLFLDALSVLEVEIASIYATRDELIERTVHFGAPRHER